MNATQALDILLALVALGSRIQGMIKKVGDIARAAQAEGRELTDSELETVNSIYNTALKSLDATIAEKET